MEKKNLMGPAIFMGLLAVATAMIISVNVMISANRSVNVRGLCEKEVMADRAIWPIVFKQGGKSLKTMSAQIKKQNADVIAWLKAAGFSDEEISVTSPKTEDLRTYTSENRSFDYMMTSVITVCTSQVDKVIEMRARELDLMDMGIAVSGSSWEYPVTFDYTSLNDIKPEMIEQATVNAREAADKFAKDSGSKVGKIISATQGQFSINSRDDNNPHIKTVRVVTTVQYQLK